MYPQFHSIRTIKLSSGNKANFLIYGTEKNKYYYIEMDGNFAGTGDTLSEVHEKIQKEIDG